MQFRKITSHKYIGDNGYSVIRGSSDTFVVCKDGKATTWGSYFTSVKAAEYFMDSHDYTHAKTDSMPISDSDLNFIIDYFGLDQIGQDKYRKGNIFIDIDYDNDVPEADVSYADRHFYATDIEDFIHKLDQIIPDNELFASVTYRGTELRPVLAAKLPPKNDKRSTKDALKNLVRVKSSNVWAYGIEIKDRKAKVGDVYVQFKGKNGGQGDAYVYYNVRLSDWRKMLAAPSKGHAVWAILRNNYPYAKLTGDRRGKLPNAVNR